MFRLDLSLNKQAYVSFLVTLQAQGMLARKTAKNQNKDE